MTKRVIPCHEGFVANGSLKENVMSKNKFRDKYGTWHPNPAPKPAQTAMPAWEMGDIIRSAKSGDKLEIIFTDETFGGDLKGRLYMLLMMHDNAVDFGEGGLMTLKAVANSNNWDGCHDYTITILEKFDADYFIGRTIGRDLLVSVKLIPA